MQFLTDNTTQTTYRLFPLFLKIPIYQSFQFVEFIFRFFYNPYHDKAIWNHLFDPLKFRTRIFNN